LEVEGELVWGEFEGLEDEAGGVAAFVEAFTASEAGGVPVHGADSANDDVALGADVREAFDGFSLRERKGVAGCFAGDSEVGTGGFPFGTMGGDAAPTVAFAGDEVCEFVEDDAGDLFFGDFGLKKLWVE
jgi:hypothetical protein